MKTLGIEEIARNSGFTWPDGGYVSWGDTDSEMREAKMRWFAYFCREQAFHEAADVCMKFAEEYTGVGDGAEAATELADALRAIQGAAPAVSQAAATPSKAQRYEPNSSRPPSSPPHQEPGRAQRTGLRAGDLAAGARNSCALELGAQFR